MTAGLAAYFLRLAQLGTLTNYDSGAPNLAALNPAGLMQYIQSKAWVRPPSAPIINDASALWNAVTWPAPNKIVCPYTPAARNAVATLAAVVRAAASTVESDSCITFGATSVTVTSKTGTSSSTTISSSSTTVTVLPATVKVEKPTATPICQDIIGGTGHLDYISTVSVSVPSGAPDLVFYLPIADGADGNTNPGNWTVNLEGPPDPGVSSFNHPA